MIYDELDYSHEADIFANHQKYVKPLLPYEIFIANIEAGNDKQLIINSLVESYGLVISHKKTTGGIYAVSTLEFIYDKYGFHTLDHALGLCIATWEGELNSLSGSVLMGIAHFITAYEDSIKDDIFKEKVGKFSIREIIRIAKERRAGSLGFAEAILIAYNKRMKSGLQWNKLYNNKRIPREIIYDEAECDIERENEEYLDDFEEPSED